MTKRLEGATAEIDLAALCENFCLLRRQVAPARVIAVVKANAYGHGTGAVVRALCAQGCDAFAVANLQEAITVRLFAPAAMILILGYTPPERARELAELDLVQTVFSCAYARDLGACAKDKNCSVPVHIKIDGGMCRLGIAPTAPAAREMLCCLEETPSLVPCGAYVHFPDAARVKPTGAAYRRFCAQAAILGKGRACFLRHAAASVAILALPWTYADAVRPGIALYGIAPTGARLSLRPAMRLLAPIVQLHRVQSGTPVGYEGAFVTRRPSLIGTLPIGYADGIPRALAGFCVKLLHGGRQFSVPIVGRVCMDMTMVDLTDTPAACGDAVSFFEELSAAAAHAGTIPYTLLSGIGARVVRVYADAAERK